MGEVLDVAIVLCAVFVSLSCACSWVQEQIASILRLRGSALYQGVLNLLVGELPLVEKVFTHPLIASGSNDQSGKIDEAGGAKRSWNIFARTYRPSYIDARNFSLAFWQSIRDTQALPAGAQAAAAVDAPEKLLEDLTDRVTAMTDGNLRTALVGLLNEAKGNYEALLNKTDAWFNAQMDRVAGWYRRQIQWILIIIAFIVALTTGFDPVKTAANVSALNTAQRDSLVNSVAAAIASPKPQNHASTGTDTPGAHKNPAKPKPSGSSDGDSGGNSSAGGNAAQQDASQQWAAVRNAIAESLDGKGASPPLAFDLSFSGNPAFLWDKLFVHDFLAIAITTLALSMGGPFWFDLLSSLVKVRQAGKKPGSGTKTADADAS